MFPEAEPAEADENTVVLDNCSGSDLLRLMREGKNAVLFGTGPFASYDVSFQLSIAGRTTGHLATVVADHPLMADFPHSGYCGRQFEMMMNGSKSAVLELTEMPHRPIVDIASSYKNAHKEAMLAEYRIGAGKLLICTLRMTDTDPAARWLKARILAYAGSDGFAPAQTLSEAHLASLCKASPVQAALNENEAMNKNDITM